MDGAEPEGMVEWVNGGAPQNTLLEPQRPEPVQSSFDISAWGVVRMEWNNQYFPEIASPRIADAGTRLHKACPSRAVSWRGWRERGPE